jgi:LysR substrate binding domain-containing protein
MQDKVLDQFARAAGLEVPHGEAAHVGAPERFILPCLHEHQNMGVIERLMQRVADAARLLHGLGDQFLLGGAKSVVLAGGCGDSGLARLLTRTTRAVTLTEEGEAYYRAGQQIIQQLNDGEQAAAAGAVKGRLRVNASIPFGAMFGESAIATFLAAHPDIIIDFSVTDDVVDLLAQKADVAIRMGSLPDTALLARKLGQSRRIVCAAPAYLKRKGTPQKPEDLRGHDYLTFNFRRYRVGWPFPVRENLKTDPVFGLSLTSRVFGLCAEWGWPVSRRKFSPRPCLKIVGHWIGLSTALVKALISVEPTLRQWQVSQIDEYDAENAGQEAACRDIDRPVPISEETERQREEHGCSDRVSDCYDRQGIEGAQREDGEIQPRGWRCSCWCRPIRAAKGRYCEDCAQEQEQEAYALEIIVRAKNIKDARLAHLCRDAPSVPNGQHAEREERHSEAERWQSVARNHLRSRWCLPT